MGRGRPRKNTLKPLKLSKSEREEQLQKQKPQIILSDIEIIKCENSKDLWGNIGDHYCLMGVNVDNMVNEFNLKFERVPKIIYNYKNNYYIPETNEEAHFWKDKINYTV